MCGKKHYNQLVQLFYSFRDKDKQNKSLTFISLR